MIFTDESTMIINIDKEQIFISQSYYPPQAFYERDKKPPSIMVWGGISPRCYRIKLIKLAEQVFR